jgi:hypothetical protein
MNWKLQYQSDSSHIQVSGFVAASEEECRQYFIRRVFAKIAESDGTEELRQHLIELETTGFDLRGLVEQVETSPKAKDWEIGEAFAKSPWRMHTKPCSHGRRDLTSEPAKPACRVLIW